LQDQVIRGTIKSELLEALTSPDQPMKNFNMRHLMASIVISVFASSATAQPSKATPPLELAKDAPDRHIVVRGDTLWGISGKFLQKPWRWPEIWQLNKEQIRNPHLIYPGDVVYLDTSSGSPRLRLGKAVGTGDGSSGSGVTKMGPQTRAESLDKSPISTINALAIEPFLSRPLVVSEKELATAPRIMATQEGRVYLASGELAYVRGLNDNASEWHIYRNSKPILDPDTREILGYEALFVGTGRIESSGDPARLRLVSVREEIGVGDRLLPVDKSRVLSYAPRPYEQDSTGKILQVHRGVSQAGKNNVVSFSLGAKQNVEVGHVLAIENTGATVIDRESAKRETVKLPNETIGHLLVFRVFDRIAYGLIMDTTTVVSIGATVKKP
jgi:nucleoid-associated protein YgaU